MTNSKTDVTNINVDNIIKPTLEKLSEEQRQGLEAWKKKRDEEFGALRAKRDQEDQDVYLSSFKVDRQGVISPIKEPEFIPLNVDIDQPAVSKSLFSSEQIAKIQYHVSQGTANVYDLMLEHEKAKKNTLQVQPLDRQPIGQVRENQLVSSIPCSTPIQSLPNPVSRPGQAVRLFGQESLPNRSSTCLTQANPATNSSLVPAKSANMDDLMAEFKRKLDQIAYDKLGVMPKHRTYIKPYPDYFDLQPYPPGYRVPEFAKFNGVDNKSTWEHISQY